MGDISAYWSVSIGGKELDEVRKRCINKVTIEEMCDGSNTCTLDINDPNFLFIEDNIFIEDAPVSVKMGIIGSTTPTEFNGYVSAIDPNFPEDGHPVISLFCLDETHVMNRIKKSRSWENVTRAQVVQIIVKEYGFKYVLQSGYAGKIEETIAQSKETDIEFIEKLAGEELELYMCKLIKGTVYYVKKGLLKAPVATFTYRQFPHDVRSFTPRINKETRQKEIESSNINSDTKETETSVASNENTVRDVIGEPIKQVRYDVNSRTWVPLNYKPVKSTGQESQ